MVYRILISVLLISILTVSCKKHHKDDPSPQVINKGPKVTSMKDVRLYNQFVAADNFFSISDSVFTTDKTSNFDLCYLNIKIGAPAKNYYVIGSPADKTYTDKAYSNLTSTNATAFYTVPASFTYADFDTLTYSSELKNFVDDQCVIIYSNTNIQLSQAVCSDDTYGWGANTVFAFKTTAGKYGMIKILAPPTGSAIETGPLLKAGVLKIDIKIQI